MSELQRVSTRRTRTLHARRPGSSRAMLGSAGEGSSACASQAEGLRGSVPVTSLPFAHRGTEPQLWARARSRPPRLAGGASRARTGTIRGEADGVLLLVREPGDPPAAHDRLAVGVPGRRRAPAGHVADRGDDLAGVVGAPEQRRQLGAGREIPHHAVAADDEVGVVALRSPRRAAGSTRASAMASGSAMEPAHRYGSVKTR